MGVLLCLWGAACGPGTAGEGRGVLVVALDGLRADHVSALGYDRRTTPGLDELAAHGWLFTQTFSSAPLHRPAHVSLLTGCDPRLAWPMDVALAKSHTGRVAADLPRLAVEFLAAGYRTAAFFDDPSFAGSMGLALGFQKVTQRDAAQDGEAAAGDGGSGLRVEQLLSWLRTVDPEEPWFAYLHVADLERSWSQPEASFEDHFRPRSELQHVPPVGNTDSVFFAIPFSRWRGGSRTVGRYEASYDGHLHELDQTLDRLFAGLRRQARDAQTTIAVVGTHGVQFGEEGLFLRSGLYSSADLHVPWILRPRAGAPTEGELLRRESGPRRIDSVTSLLDLAPTLLANEGLQVPAAMQGVPQLGIERGLDTRPRYVFASSGLMPGAVTISDRFVLEEIEPDRIEDAGLRRSWFGSDSLVERGRLRRCYDRTRTTYPGLASFEDDSDSAGLPRVVGDGGTPRDPQPDRAALDPLVSATRAFTLELSQRRNSR